MPYRLTPFVTDGFYHIFNRGVEKRDIFMNDRDYQRFLQTLYYYQFMGPKPRFSTQKRFRKVDFESNPRIVEIVCYCLMPNHFHLLIKQTEDNGIHEFLMKTLNSYTKYFNTKHNRVGPLLQGQSKAVSVDSDEQLIHLSRYIHLNPYVSDLTKDWKNFPYSSYPEFANFQNKQNSSLGKAICTPNYILNFFSKSQPYEDFIKDHASYAYDLAKIQHLLIDVD